MHPHRLPATVAVLLLVVGCLLPCHSTHADALAEVRQGDDALTRELESLYRDWQRAITSRDITLWTRTTAESRQAITRNLIISEKQPWPAALFRNPFPTPETNLLRHMATRYHGPTAQLAYFGRIRLDERPTSQSPESIALIHFLDEGNGWRFDSLQIIDLTQLADVRAAMQQGNTEFLDDPTFLPSGQLPSIPDPAESPEFIAKIYANVPQHHLVAIINDTSKHQLIANISAEVVIGGIKTGKNAIRFILEPLEENAEPPIVSVYLMPDDLPHPGAVPVLVYHFEPDSPEAVRVEETFTIDDAVIEQRIRD